MEIIQWAVAAGTATFVAMVGYYQWRPAEQKAALDLFERRHEIYQVVINSVAQMVRNSVAFDPQQEREFLLAMARAYFFWRRRSSVSQTAVGRHSYRPRG